MLATFQQIQGAKACRIANYNDETDDPLMNAAQMPSDHVLVEKYFKFFGTSKQWLGTTIPENKTRKIIFSFLLSNVEIPEMVEAVTVYLMDHQLSLEYKSCQAISHEMQLHTVHVSNKCISSKSLPECTSN
jgi:hypothetical protein